MDSLTLKCHNSFQNLNDRRAKHSFVPRSLTFKLQQDVLNLMTSARVGALQKLN